MSESATTPSRREDKRELRALKRRLRPLKRSLSCWLGNHDFAERTGDRLGLCRYCYTPNHYIGQGLSHRLERWEEAVDEAEADGVIPSA